MGDTAVTPRVTGPIVGGRGWPFGRPVTDLDQYRYVEEEYFVEGHAARFRPVAGTELGRDGRWDTEPIDTAPYKTRIVVYRPSDPAQFNGTVFVSWDNVSAGFDLLFGAESPVIYDSGAAYVAVTSQPAGVQGLPPVPMGLTQWDPERYGSLSIASDDYSFDIFTQAARAIGPDRARGPIDPMGGLEVRTLIAMGASQSAGRLSTYINAVHPLVSVIDGFLLIVYFGSGYPLEVGDYLVNFTATPDDRRISGGAVEGGNLIRDDIEAQVMVVNSEMEGMVIAFQGLRQPDSDHFRYWEVAGTAHMSRPDAQAGAAKFERDFGAELAQTRPRPNPEGMNAVSMAPVFNAAMHHLAAWVDQGTPPPSQPLIEFATDPPQIIRDEHGNALGGIRLPQLEVPIALNSGVSRADDIMSRLGGASVPFPADKLRSLYGDHETYVAQFAEAARSAQQAGVLLSPDVDLLIDEARCVPFD